MARRSKQSAELSPWYEFRAQGDDEQTAEIRIFGPIGGGFFADEDAPSGKNIAEKLEALPEDVKTIRVLINSPGGNVFDGIHIANALRRQREEHGRNVVVDVEALAASAATIISSAGNPVRMPRNALMMIHNPSAMVMGDQRTMRRVADVLEKVTDTIVATYRWISSLGAEALRDLMNETTWMDAEEALENGLAHEITDPVEATASLEFNPGALPYADDIPDEYRERVFAILNAGADSSAATSVDTPNQRTVEPTTAEEPTRVDAGTDPEDQPMAKKDDQKTTPNSGQDAAPQVEPQNDGGPDLEAATKAERKRIQTIRNRVQVANLGDEVADELIDSGATVEQAAERIFAELADAEANTDGPSPNGQRISITPGEDERDRAVQGISAALWSRAGVSNTIRRAMKERPDHPEFQNISLDPGEFRGLTLFDHARDAVEAVRGFRSTRGMSRREVVRAFFNIAGQGRDNFSTALEDAMHKTLLSAYVVAPDTWRSFCRVGTVSDFRVHNRYRPGFLARLREVVEGAEYKRRDISDAEKETIQAKKFGEMISLTREAIINDDMGFFDDMAMFLGRAAALSIELEVYDLLGLNSGLGPAMNNGNPLFDAAHNNVSGGAALSAATIDDDAELMAGQTDPSGNETLNLQPSILLVPRSLRGTALTINESEFDPDTAGSNKPNTVRGFFDEVIATTRLSGTRRYLFADPGIEPVLEVAFLDGEQEPYMEMQDGWNVDGVDWKVRLEFAADAVGFRGAVTDAGQ